MPTVDVKWSNKVDSNKKAELKDSLIEIVSDAISADKGRVDVFLNEYDSSNVSNENCAVVRVTWIANPLRDAAMKASLIEKITAKMAEFPEVKKEKCIVIIEDTPADSVGVGGIPVSKR